MRYVNNNATERRSDRGCMLVYNNIVFAGNISMVLWFLIGEIL